MRRKRNIKVQPTGTHKHVPQRTCLGCRQIKTKRELIRIVRTPDGEIEIDTGGKKAGRGAYLCKSPECWEQAIKGNRLEYALRGKLPRDNRENLLKESQKLLEGAN